MSGAALSPRGQTDARMTLAYITNYERQPRPAQAWESSCNQIPASTTVESGFSHAHLLVVNQQTVEHSFMVAELNNFRKVTHVRIFNTSSNSAFIYKMVW